MKVYWKIKGAADAARRSPNVNSHKYDVAVWMKLVDDFAVQA